MFKANQKVKLHIGNITFNRTVAYVSNGAVYLCEGGNAFCNETGINWAKKEGFNSRKNSYITAA